MPRKTTSHPLARSLCKPKVGQVFTARGEEYRLGGKIGDGAAGLVRKATRSRDGALHAVKFLAPDPKYIDENKFSDVEARFRREGLRAQALQHQNLVSVYSYEENSSGSAFRSSGPENPFVVMEYVKGRSLESYIRKVHPSQKGEFIVTEDRLSVAIAIAEALDYLHRRKIVHRDVKPANVFLSDAQVAGGFLARLGDFGVVKWGDFHASVATGTLTVTSQQGLGTLKYMAPEQALSPKEVTVRADIYSLGVTLFELFTGSVLASAHHVFSIMSARLARGNSVGRFQTLGIQLPYEFAELGGMILDMHLRGTEGRPAIRKVVGLLKWQYDSMYGER